MDELLERLANLRLPVRIALLAVLVAAVLGGYYFLFYSDVLDERAQLESAHAQLVTEKDQYERRKKEYLAFRNEVNQLLEEQKELVRMLPKRDDIEQFIENINAQVELSGLTKVASVRDPDQPGDIYIRIPIKMSLVGTFHSIARFFKNVGELKRIVTVADLQLHPEDATGATQRLKAEFTAATFQFIEKNPPPVAASAPAPTGAAPGAPPGAAPGAPPAGAAPTGVGAAPGGPPPAGVGPASPPAAPPPPAGVTPPGSAAAPPAGGAR